MTLEFHPLANVLPLLAGAEFDALVGVNGEIKSEVLHEGSARQAPAE